MKKIEARCKKSRPDLVCSTYEDYIKQFKKLANPARGGNLKAWSRIQALDFNNPSFMNRRFDEGVHLFRA